MIPFTRPEFFVFQVALASVGIFAAMLAFQALGRSLGKRHRRANPEHDKGIGASEGAVFGILGLYLAFTFSGAGERFDQRRHLIIEEANAIGTAWLRIDVLPEADRPELRRLFREYLDARLETYRKVPDMAAVAAANARAMDLQQQIWNFSVAACARSGSVPAHNLMLPALNDMIDITTTRTAATQVHPPAVVFGVLVLLAIVGSLFAGYGFAARGSWSWFHSIGFAAVIAGSIFVILNLEYPRLGLIRVNAMDQVLVDLRKSMK